MLWQDMALVAAGTIGAGTSLMHGVLMQRFMVTPFSAALAREGRTTEPLMRLLPVLMHFSTFAWFVAGGALIAAALASEREIKLAVVAGAGVLYLFGVVGNAWATRGRHPGWMLLAVSCALMVAGIA